MFLGRCRAPVLRSSCKPCAGSLAVPGSDTVRVDFKLLGEAGEAAAARAAAPGERAGQRPVQQPVEGGDQPQEEGQGGVLKHIKQAAKDLLEHLSDIALEYEYEELSEATGGFAAEKCLGEGGAGAVYRGVLRGGTEVAVKVLVDRGGAEGFEDEVRILSRLRHLNLVTLLGFGQHGGKKYIVYELCPGGDLQGRLRGRKEGSAPFTWQERLRVARDSACGLSHMVNGQPRAFHRDIKPPNILLDSDGTAKMADFGLAGFLQGDQQETDEPHLAVKHVSGTPGYMCPSYMRTRRVTEQSEVYSFGVVLLELLVNKPPCLSTQDGELVYPLLEAVRPAAAGAHARIMAGLDPAAGWPVAIAEDLGDLALACVDLVPTRRPPFEVVLSSIRRLGWAAADIADAAARLPPPPPPVHAAPIVHRQFQGC